MEMPNRREQHRRSARRIFRWSLAVAVALHVIVFLTVPGLRTSVVAAFRDQTGDPDLPSALPLDLFFGPPSIENASGELLLEPPERVLHTDRLVSLPATCRAIIKGSGTVMRGSVSLTVGPEGFTDVHGIVESTGFPCGDGTLERVAGDLWYRWLPNDEFPAPVQLIQPMVFQEKTGM